MSIFIIILAKKGELNDTSTIQTFIKLFTR